MKPVDSNVSPYLQQPLRTLEQVLQERLQRQRQPAADGGKGPSSDSTPAPAAVPPKRIDQTV